MKNDRQSMILQVIEEETVETQEQLMQLLAQRGLPAPRPPFPATSSSSTS